MFEEPAIPPAAVPAADLPGAIRSGHDGRDTRLPRRPRRLLRAVLAAGLLAGSASLVPGLAGGFAHAASGFVYTNPGLSLLQDQNTGSVLVATTQFVPSVNVLGAPNPTIDWGDGTVDTVAPASCSPQDGGITCNLVDSHIYQQPGTFTITTTYYTGALISYSATTPVTVSAPTSLFPSPYNFSPTEASPYSGTVANFLDSNTTDPAGAFSAIIDWGDGTITGGTVFGAGGFFGVNGTHTYAEGGRYPVEVKIAYGSSVVDVYSTAFVADAALSANGLPFQATAGAPFSGAVANFTDAGPNPAASQYQVSIDWGGGTALDSTGTVAVATGVSAAPAQRVATVQPAADPAAQPTADPGTQITGNPGASAATTPAAATPVPQPQTATPLPSTAPAPQQPATPAPQVATPVAKPTPISSGNAFVVNGSHVYAAAGTYTVTVKITDLGGSTVTASGTATVQAQPAASSTPVPGVGTPAATTTPVPGVGTPAATATTTPTQPATPAAGNGQVIVLDGGANDCTLLIQGGSLNATGVAVDGTSPNATCLNGGTLVAQTLTQQGGTRNQGGTIQAGTTVSGRQIADPYSGLTPPSQPSAVCPGSACPDGTNFNSGQTYRLLPGYYNQWLNFNTGSVICLAPGTYYLDGGWNVNTDLLPYGSKGCPALPAASADPGVTLYFHTGSLQLNSGANVSNLGAPQSGPYSGLLYWQASPDGLYPNATVGVNGAWYAPNAQLTLNSGASLAANLVVVKDLTVNGGASLTAPAS